MVGLWDDQFRHIFNGDDAFFGINLLYQRFREGSFARSRRAGNDNVFVRFDRLTEKAQIIFGKQQIQQAPVVDFGTAQPAG